MTQTAKHTPGPWAYDGEDIDNIAAQLVAEEEGTEHDGYEIFSIDKNGEVDEPIGTALTEEDAKLIAAAPDMAEALKEAENIIVESWISGFCEGRSDLNNGDIAQEKVNTWRKKVTAALAKAGIE